MDWVTITIVIVLAILLIVILVIRNLKDEKKFEEQLNADDMHKNDAMRKNELYV